MGFQIRRFFIFLFLPCALLGQIPPSEKVSPADQKLLDAEIQRVQHLQETAGDKCTVSYALARTWAYGGQYRQALSSLKETIDLDAGIDPSNDDVFGKLRGTNEFKLLQRQVREDTPPVANSREAFTIDVPDLVPESMARDQRRKRFYLGSTWHHSIIECTAMGDCRPFTKEGQDGLYEVLGIKVDPSDGTVWVVSNATGESGLFHYKAPGGDLIRKFTLGRTTEMHLFNDIAISSKGDVFLTDTRANTVYWVSHETNRLEVFDPKLRVDSANGIAISSDDKTLYVAGFPDGITVVDVASKSSHPIAHPADLCLGTIDGLAYYSGSLVAIQNGIMTPRVVRYRLTSDLQNIQSFKILERRNPLFDGITTGAVADDSFYFMANTQLDKVQGGRIKPGAQFNPIKILSVDLVP